MCTSKFGLGSAGIGSMLGGKSVGGQKVIVLFVIGGITAQEVSINES